MLQGSRSKSFVSERLGPFGLPKKIDEEEINTVGWNKAFAHYSPLFSRGDFIIILSAK